MVNAAFSCLKRPKAVRFLRSTVGSFGQFQRPNRDDDFHWALFRYQNAHQIDAS